jgi:DNA-directed RNA polymerase subunit M/transcription elongation factor TFIIS
MLKKSKPKTDENKMQKTSFQTLEKPKKIETPHDVRHEIDFCPQCGKLLKLVNKGVPTLYCPKCRFKTQLAHIKTAKQNVHFGRPKEIAVIEKNDEFALRPLPTVKAICPICGKAESETWVVAVGGEAPPSTVTFFRCTNCGATRRETG